MLRPFVESLEIVVDTQSQARERMVATADEALITFAADGFASYGPVEPKASSATLVATHHRCCTGCCHARRMRTAFDLVEQA